MLRLWLTRRWLGWTMLAILFAAACFQLGLWQWHRYEEQRTKVTAIEANYDAPAVPLESLLVGDTLAPDRQWTHVTVTGRFLQDADLFVRNRTLDRTVGFEVVTPFVTDATTVLVDRGWVPNAREADTTPPADPPPAGSVTVTGWARSGEPSLGRDLPPPQLASISIADARDRQPIVGPADLYVVLGSQAPPAGEGDAPVRPLPRPQEDLGPHQAYALQWWITMPLGLVFVVWALRRETIQALPEHERPVRPKKVRIWDEEDA